MNLARHSRKKTRDVHLYIDAESVKALLVTVSVCRAGFSNEYSLQSKLHTDAVRNKFQQPQQQRQNAIIFQPIIYPKTKT